MDQHYSYKANVSAVGYRTANALIVQTFSFKNIITTGDAAS